MCPGPSQACRGVWEVKADELPSEPPRPEDPREGPRQRPLLPGARLCRLNADHLCPVFNTWRIAGQAHGGRVSLGIY